MKLNFTDITRLSGNVVHEVDKQCNSVVIPTGNIRFQGELHSSWHNSLQIFFTEKKKKKVEVIHILISSTGLPTSQFNF